MSSKYLPPKDELKYETVGRWSLVGEIGRGKNGVVYEARNKITDDITDYAAVKLVPVENLKLNWQAEIQKAVLLEGIEQSVPFKGYQEAVLRNRPYAALFWKYEHGPNLRTFVKRFPLNITISFIDNLLEQLLRLLLAMADSDISHCDLHEGNIIIAEPDHRKYELLPAIKVTDFGIGSSINGLEPKDDYIQVASLPFSFGVNRPGRPHLTY
jgi:serine/threonine protein kinase